MGSSSSKSYDYQDQTAVAVSCWRVSDLDISTRSGTPQPGDPDANAAIFGDVDQAAVLAVAKGHSGLSPAQLEERLDTIEPFLAEIAPSRACLWRHVAAAVGSWRSSWGAEPGCLIVVRQPLKSPDAAAQRDWVQTVLHALETDPAPAPGLCSASFFATGDGSHVLNLAGWTSAEAHKAALGRGRAGQHGSVGVTPEWVAVRAHPAIQPQHEVRRFTLLADNVLIQPSEALTSMVQPA